MSANQSFPGRDLSDTSRVYASPGADATTTSSTDSMPTQRREAWAYLSRVVEGPSRRLNELLSHGVDVEDIARGVREQQDWLGELRKQTATRHEWMRPAEDLEAIEQIGGRLITPEDAEWPTEIFSEAFGFAASGMSEHCRSYQDDAVPPHALWVRGGGPLSGLVSRSVALVGTRGTSTYGLSAARLLSRGLASHQWTIVSGGAKGIDTAAHTEAIDAGGYTVMVAASGLDVNYPASNTELFTRIATHGCLVSEYPPGTHPARHRFLTRNRLVAALAGGTVIVEAGWRSGALNTLSWAEGLGRVAMAVPGPITSNTTMGCHARIKNGSAQLVTSADDIRELLEPVGTCDPDGQREIDFSGSPVTTLTRTEMRLFDACSSSFRTSTEIARDAGLPLGLAMHVLVDLASRGFIVRSGKLWARAQDCG